MYETDANSEMSACFDCRCVQFGAHVCEGRTINGFQHSIMDWNWGAFDEEGNLQQKFAICAVRDESEINLFNYSSIKCAGEYSKYCGAGDAKF